MVYVYRKTKGIDMDKKTATTFFQNNRKLLPSGAEYYDEVGGIVKSLGPTAFYVGIGHEGAWVTLDFTPQTTQPQLERLFANGREQWIERKQKVTPATSDTSQFVFRLAVDTKGA